jgi:hypothetical protein
MVQLVPYDSLTIPSPGLALLLILYISDSSEISQFILLNIGFITRIDQGHLHYNLEVAGLICPSQVIETQAYAMGGEHSRKEPLEQLVHSYPEHLHMNAHPVENC